MRGNRGGEGRASEGRCEGNAVKQGEAERAEKDTGNRKSETTLQGGGKTSESKYWPNAHLMLEDRVFSRTTQI